LGFLAVIALLDMGWKRPYGRHGTKINEGEKPAHMGGLFLTSMSRD